MCSHIFLQISTKSLPPLASSALLNISGVAFVNDEIRVVCILQNFHNFINLQDVRHLHLAIDQ
jgi:hypothetical protein